MLRARKSMTVIRQTSHKNAAGFFLFKTSTDDCSIKGKLGLQ